ncbi:uncharacterized protein DS421_19g648110 [Arachis hypogaea]|uniref:Uncharacterized protein n=1 Tax=Arachis hypogaea TaxID=3818 RepID=A0A6B9V5Q2_ARAHY|nr:uncharacterized protein DS421_19g648110 [Arachis hypogaea]
MLSQIRIGALILMIDATLVAIVSILETILYLGPVKRKELSVDPVLRQNIEA